MRKRLLLFATLAVVLIGTACATAVFLVGSKQRRDDRASTAPLRGWLHRRGLGLGPTSKLPDPAAARAS